MATSFTDEWYSTLHGVPLRIEYRPGDERAGTSKDGKGWSRELKHYYGRIARTEGADREPIDFYLSPHGNIESPFFIVDQLDQETGEFDEHKVMVGFDTEREAREAYLENYPSGWEIGTVKRMEPVDFMQWLDEDDTTGPIKKTQNTDLVELIEILSQIPGVDGVYIIDDTWENVGDPAEKMEIPEVTTRKPHSKPREPRIDDEREEGVGTTHKADELSYFRASSLLGDVLRKEEEPLTTTELGVARRQGARAHRNRNKPFAETRNVLGNMGDAIRNPIASIGQVNKPLQSGAAMMDSYNHQEQGRKDNLYKPDSPGSTVGTEMQSKPSELSEPPKTPKPASGGLGMTKGDELSLYRAIALLGEVMRKEPVYPELKMEIGGVTTPKLPKTGVDLKDADPDAPPKATVHYGREKIDVPTKILPSTSTNWERFQATNKSLEVVLTKDDWKPFQGPRGGMGVYNPRTRQVEYGVNAERRVRMETSGRKVENPYLDLDALVAQLMSGARHPRELDREQMLAAYNHVSQRIQSGVGDPGYKELKNRLETELGGSGMEGQIPTGR